MNVSTREAYAPVAAGQLLDEREQIRQHEMYWRKRRSEGR